MRTRGLMDHCERCGIRMDWSKLAVPGGEMYGLINAWLCLDCIELYGKALDEFHKDFLQPQKNPEAPTEVKTPNSADLGPTSDLR